MKTKVVIFLLNGAKSISEFFPNNQSVLPRIGESVYVDDMGRMEVADISHNFIKDSTQSEINIIVRRA